VKYFAIVFDLVAALLHNRAFQFGQKSFDSIRQSENLPDSDGEFGEGPGGVSLCCGSFCAILDNFQQVKNVSKVLNAAENK